MCVRINFILKRGRLICFMYHAAPFYYSSYLNHNGQSRFF